MTLCRTTTPLWSLQGETCNTKNNKKKLETLDEDIYSAILEYYDGSNDTTESEELLQLPSDGDKQSS